MTPWATALAQILCVVALLTCAHAQVAPKPLSKDDVVTLLKGDVSPKRVEELIQQRGIDFVVTTEVERQLRKLGATSSLLAKLKDLAPKPAATVPMPVAPPPVPTPQPAPVAALPPAVLEIQTNPAVVAMVYLDGNLKGPTNSDGRLQVQYIPSGQHRLNLDVPNSNYQSYIETVNLAPGRNLKLVTLISGGPSAGTVQEGTGKGVTTFEFPTWHYTNHAKAGWGGNPTQGHSPSRRGM